MKKNKDFAKDSLLTNNEGGIVNKFIFSLIMALFFVADLSFAKMVDRIVAVVNDEIITLSELNTSFEPFRRGIEGAYRGKDREFAIADARNIFLNKLIDTALINQEAKKSGLSVKDEEVMAAITDIRKRRNLSEEEMTKELAAGGLSWEDYKKELRQQLTKMKLIRREIKTKVMVTNEEIGEYYRKHRQDYEGREAVRAKQIFFPFPGGISENAKAQLRKNVEDIRERLKKGEPFDLLAAKFSQGSAAVSGDLGFIEKGMVHPEVENAAFGMELGEISGVIQSRVGFHIIMVTDKKGGGVRPIESVREEIQMRIEEQKLEKKFEEWMEQLRKRAHIEVKL